MQRDLSNDVHMFMREMSTYMAVYAAYAVAVGSIAIWLEWRSLFHENLPAALLANVFSVSTAVVLLTIGSFITTWRSNWLGGERSSFFITAAVSVVTIGVVKAYSCSGFGIALTESLSRSAMLALTLQAPNLLVGVIVFFLWGKGL